MTVEIRQLSRHFGSVEAVKRLSLDIREGETFGLLGPNGAGKTTTLSMLATLLPPTSGDASLGGCSLARDPRGVRRRVGIAPQTLSLYPDLTGEENLRFFARLNGVARREREARVAHVLALVGLEARRADRVRGYSGGMQRRLNLACALVHGPRVVLLDEPTAGVDPQSRENLLNAIRGLAADGTTVLYTTHYMEEAERLCDRIAILDEGRMLAVGTLDELLEIVGLGEVIEVRSPAAGFDPDRLRALPEVSRVDEEPGTVRLFVKNAARALGPVAALLEKEGGSAAGLEVYRVNLERVFMHLTGHSLRD